MGLGYKGELDIESIIGAPLVAASKANSMMQSKQVQFLLDTCFNLDDKNNDVLSPVMVKMVLTNYGVDYSESMEGGIPVTENRIEFQIPLISLIPINSLAVNSVDIDFNMEITSMNRTVSNDKEQNVILKGKIAKSHQSKDGLSKGIQESYDLNVKICAGSLPLPKGVIELIDIYTKSIQPVRSSTDKTE